MEYRTLGNSGLKLSELSLGSWLTFGDKMDLDAVKSLIHIAYESGINFFDNAEVYANGASELLMGESLRDFRRENIVVSTKIFWGGPGPNDTGHSWKHLIEGAKNSLRRLQTDYVDLIYCHRRDTTTSVEEAVRAMDTLIKQGHAFYWGTSEWDAEYIEEAHIIAREIGATPPVVEQPEYNLFHRQRVEREYAPLYKKYGMGTTIWSPLASGVLAGKYNEGIPEGSRLDQNREFLPPDLQQRVDKVKQLEPIVADLGCSMAQFALAWCLKNPDVSTVIIGASRTEQFQENLGALAVKERLTDSVMEEIDAVMAKEPVLAERSNS
jgi:voltage-dependent potassium channel beta subunit